MNASPLLGKQIQRMGSKDDVETDEECKEIKNLLHRELVKIQSARFEILDNSIMLMGDTGDVKDLDESLSDETEKSEYNGSTTSLELRRNMSAAASFQRKMSTFSKGNPAEETHDLTSVNLIPDIVEENSSIITSSFVLEEEAMTPQINQEQVPKIETVDKEPEEVKVEPLLVKKMSRVVPQACSDIMDIVNEPIEPHWKSVCNAKEVQVYKKKVLLLKMSK